MVLVGWKVSLIVASVFGFVEISQRENAPWKTINFRLDFCQLATHVLISGCVASKGMASEAAGVTGVRVGEEPLTASRGVTWSLK